ncbi:hypothetical protein DNTS_005463, partial [Danionella cerebrum]
NKKMLRLLFLVLLLRGADDDEDDPQEGGSQIKELCLQNPEKSQDQIKSRGVQMKMLLCFTNATCKAENRGCILCRRSKDRKLLFNNEGLFILFSTRGFQGCATCKGLSSKLCVSVYL